MEEKKIQRPLILEIDEANGDYTGYQQDNIGTQVTLLHCRLVIQNYQTEN